MESWFVILILGGIALLVTILYSVYRKGREAFIREKKVAFQRAIKSGNKGEALKAGREYYRELRGGVLSIFDEQAIANDLSTMSSEKSQNTE